MITVLVVMLAGIFLGFFLNRFPKTIEVNNRLISGAIYLLLFLLGISVGLNKTIMQNLAKIGGQALIISLGAIAGSVLSLWFVYRFFFQPEHFKGTGDEE